MDVNSEVDLAKVSDEQLLHAISTARNHEAFEVLFDRYEREAYAFALYVTGSSELAETAVQMAMLCLWLYAGSFKGGDAHKWIMTVVARESLKELKAQRRKAAATEISRKAMRDPVEQAAQAGERHELSTALKEAVEQLPTVERQIVTLYYTAELQLEEIGGALQISRQGVAYRLKKALERMRAHLLKAGFASALPLLDSGEWVTPFLQSCAPAPVGIREACLKLLANPPAQVLRSSIRAAAAKSNTASILMLVGAVTALAGAGLWLSTKSGPKPEVPPPPQLVAGPLVAPAALKGRVWHFDTADDVKDLTCFDGKWEFRAGQGTAGSGCMAVGNAPMRVAFGIGIQQLPIAVNFQVSADQRGGFVAHAGWGFYTLRAELKNYYPIKDFALKRWYSASYYFSERYVAVFIDGEQIGFFLEERHPGAPLTLSLSGHLKIDDLVVREITPAELPNCDHLLSALDRIPHDQRIGQVVVPELKALRGRESVMLNFHPPFLPKKPEKK